MYGLVGGVLAFWLSIRARLNDEWNGALAQRPESGKYIAR